jgi:long-chain fatty acid transport protein
MFNYTKYVLGIILSFCMVSQSFAIGGSFISNEVLSARSAGQGYVGVAGQNNDPMAVYTNPAAMTALKGTQVTLGATLENIHGGYKDAQGNETKERVTNVGVPNLAVTQSFLDGKLAAGLSAESAYGLETHWDANGPFNLLATNTRLDTVDVSPAVAYQILPQLSVGAGADYVNVFNAQMDSQSAFPLVPQTAVADLRGQGTGWGYHAGAVIEPTEQHAIGIAYHSKVDLRINGHITTSPIPSPYSQLFGPSVSISAYTDLVLPENIQFGYAYKPTEKWMLEADTAWYHWSSAKDLDVRNGSGVTVEELPLNLRDAWSAAVGANYKVNSKWQVRSGFWYEPWATPEAYFSPAFMDLTRYGLSFGTGYGITDSLTVDAAYTAVFMHNRTIHNAYVVDNGTYSDFANLFALNFTYRFGGK